MRKTLRRAPKPHLLANIIASFPTPIALPTRNPHFKRYSIADTKVRDGRAERGHHTSRLVAHAQRLAHHDIAVAAVVVVVQIRAAETGAADGDLQFVCLGVGERTRLDAEVFGAVQHADVYGVHGFVLVVSSLGVSRTHQSGEGL